MDIVLNIAWISAYFCLLLIPPAVLVIKIQKRISAENLILKFAHTSIPIVLFFVFFFFWGWLLGTFFPRLNPLNRDKGYEYITGKDGKEYAVDKKTGQKSELYIPDKDTGYGKY